MGERTDSELYLAACTGDRDAFQALAERHHVYSLRLAATALGEASASAEDVAHKAWLNVCRHLKQVEDGEREPLKLVHEASFMAWLKTVTTNAANDEHRRRARRSVSVLEDDDVIYQPDYDEGLIFEQQQSAVWSAFQRISEKCRELLLLLIQDPPLDYSTISEILGRPIGAIGPTRARCIDQLRVQIGA
jgi:RNA polymerase sigma factor (sigma-70 family)